MTVSIFENVAQMKFFCQIARLKTIIRWKIKISITYISKSKMKNEIFWKKKEFKNIRLQATNVSFDLTS